MTADDIKKYLNDSDTVFSAFDDLTCTVCSSTVLSDGAYGW